VYNTLSYTYVYLLVLISYLKNESLCVQSMSELRSALRTVWYTYVVGIEICAAYSLVYLCCGN
jgi:hypothetical protein